MLGLLNTFFRKQDANPVTNLGAVKRFVSSLPLQDEYEAHHMIVNTLNLFNSSTEPLNLERFKVLVRLDESSQALQDSLCRQYLKNQVTLKHAEKALWKEIFALYWHLAHGYQAFIREVVSQRGESELSQFLPMLTTRAMHYFGMEVKWRYFHQEAVEPNMWRRLHKFYRIAESARFVREKVELAGGISTTCADEYLQILLLDLLTPTSLRSNEIEMVDRLLNRWSKQLDLDRQVDPAYHTHAVDFAEGAGAERLVDGDIAGDKLRYLSINDVVEALGRVIAGLRAGDPPEKHDLPMDCRLPKCIDLLEQISILWQRGAAQRLIPRERGRRPVEVACGLDVLKAKLRPGATAIEEPVSEHAYWALVNESDRGMGLKIDSPATESPAIGTLIGIRTLGGNESWEIGTVRWISATDENRLSVGVEKLSQSPRLVELQSVENPLVETRDVATDHIAVEALFLPRVDEHGMTSSLILPAQLYGAGRLLDLFDNSVIYRVRMANLIEQNDVWARAKFDILGRRQL